MHRRPSLRRAALLLVSLAVALARPAAAQAPPPPLSAGGARLPGYVNTSGLFVNIIAGLAPGVAGNDTDRGMLYATYWAPMDCAFEPVTNSLFVADTRNARVQVTDMSVGHTTTVSVFVDGERPLGVASDARGKNAYVTTDWGGVYAVSRLSGRRTVLAGDTVDDGSAMPRDGVGTDAVFGLPVGVARDLPEDLLFVADEAAGAIRRVDFRLNGVGVVATVAGVLRHGSNRTGRAVVDGVGTAQARLSAPNAVALDRSSKVLYFTDRLLAVHGGDSGTVDFSSAPTGAGDDDRRGIYVAAAYVRAVQVGSGAVWTLGGGAPTGFADGGGAAAAFRFHYRDGLAIDERSKILYVSDHGNSAVRYGTPYNRSLSPDGTAPFTTLAGAPPPLNESDYADGVVEVARFGGPSGLSLDLANGLLYVADAARNMIRQVRGVPSGSLPRLYTQSPSPSLSVLTMSLSAELTESDELRPTTSPVSLSPTRSDTREPSWSESLELTPTPTDSDTPPASPSATMAASVTPTYSYSRPPTHTVTATLTATRSPTWTDALVTLTVTNYSFPVTVTATLPSPSDTLGASVSADVPATDSPSATYVSRTERVTVTHTGTHSPTQPSRTFYVPPGPTRSRMRRARRWRRPTTMRPQLATHASGS